MSSCLSQGWSLDIRVSPTQLFVRCWSYTPLIAELRGKCTKCSQTGVVTKWAILRTFKGVNVIVVVCLRSESNLAVTCPEYESEKSMSRGQAKSTHVLYLATKVSPHSSRHAAYPCSEDRLASPCNDSEERRLLGI